MFGDAILILYYDAKKKSWWVTKIPSLIKNAGIVNIFNMQPIPCFFICAI